MTQTHQLGQYCTHSEVISFIILFIQQLSFLPILSLLVFVPHSGGRCSNKEKPGKQRQRLHRLGQGGDNSSLLK